MDNTLSEDELIEAVIRVREALGAVSASAVHAALTEQGVKVTLPAVKKAASKATKRVGAPATKAESDPVAAPPAPSAAKLCKQEKAEKAKLKADAAALKAAENEMMEAQRKLRAAKSGSEAITISGTAEEFIQKVTAVALAATLEEDDARFLKERVEADIAALEWVKLASASGALRLSEDVVALGMELQLTRLKEVRGVKDYAAARACYVEDKRAHDTLDQAMQRSEAFAAAAQQEQTGGDKMEDMD